MKVKMPDGKSQEISSYEIAQPCARHLRELAPQLDNLSMNFAKDGAVTGVWPEDGDLETRIGELLDDGWRPIGFLGTKREGDVQSAPGRGQSAGTAAKVVIYQEAWPKNQTKEYSDLQALVLDGISRELAENLGPKSGETPKKVVRPALVGLVVVSNDGDLAWAISFWDHGDVTMGFFRRVRDGIVRSPSPDQFKRDVPADPRFHTPPQRPEVIEWMAAKIKEVLANGDKTQWNTAELKDIRHTLTLAIDQKRIDDPTFFTLMPAQQKSTWRPSQELLDELETRAARSEQNHGDFEWALVGIYGKEE